MSGISNRLYLTALEDGTTLHANLACDKSLTQAWNGTTASPNWTIAAQQPTIYLTLLSGGAIVQPEAGYKWYYNDGRAESEITDQSTKFQITQKQIRYGGVQYTVPALKIIDNLADSANVDIDTIIFKGSYNAGGSSLAFSCSIQVRISSMNGQGYVPTIDFLNGVSDITEAGQTVTMEGVIYDGETGQSVSGVTTSWYLNDVSIAGVSGTNTCIVSESQVTDHATVRCEFFDSSSNKLGTAFAYIDDMQDPEYMYIQYNGNNGNAASLRNGDTATFQIWVGTREDPTVRTVGGVYEYQYIYIMLLDGDGNIATNSGLTVGIPDVANPNLEAGQAGYGYRQLTMSAGKATFTPDYSTVVKLKKNMTGIIMAYTSRPDWHPVSQ